MKSIYNLLLSCCFLLLTVEGFATHNRAGEITYKHVSGFTYEFTITTYTKVSGVSGDADRTRLGIAWGDGTFDSLDRISETFLDADIKQNKYIGIHTYSGQTTRGWYARKKPSTTTPLLAPPPIPMIPPPAND